MQIESIEGYDKRVNGTSLRGYINGDYGTLVETFGEPLADGDDYKSDAEWILVLNDDVVVTSDQTGLMSSISIDGTLVVSLTRVFSS